MPPTVQVPIMQCIALCIQPCEIQCRETRPATVCLPLCQQTCETTCLQTQQNVMPCQVAAGGGCNCNSGYTQCGGMCCRA
ncbi:hypothetical protein ANCCAN_08662 [Ancylostoma caninum]|uniref:Cysteine rich repeat-containing domain protein n=1 Tax=Ancylostoma caninum TaxID=29170 RepID=A0A368GLV9_ANCCA|nr:hypothetical protein ANCCAN_08662 [Ancylostoma caninum]